jgi:serine/threonine protein kinase
MAPEQASTRGYDERVDIYAVGILLYEMLCGEVPHRGPSYQETLILKSAEPPPLLREQRPEIPQKLEQLVLRCLSYAPDERPATMTELAQEVRGLVETEELEEPPLDISSDSLATDPTVPHLDKAPVDEGAREPRALLGDHTGKLSAAGGHNPMRILAVIAALLALLAAIGLVIIYSG